jgi:hypothetical protein
LSGNYNAKKASIYIMEGNPNIGTNKNKYNRIKKYINKVVNGNQRADVLVELDSTPLSLGDGYQRRLTKSRRRNLR